MRRWYDEVENLYDAEGAADLFRQYKIKPVSNCVVAAWSSNTFTATSVDEALRSKDFVVRFKKMFAEGISLAEHACMKNHLSGPDVQVIKTTTAEYPKILVDESGIDLTKRIGDDFRDAGGIHLPFPAVVLCGFGTEANNFIGFKEGYISKESTLTKALASVSNTYLYEYEDHIHALVMTVHPHMYFRGFMPIRIEYNQATGKIDCSIKSYVGQKHGFLLAEDAFKLALSKILYGIHKMTFSDGDLHVSMPTPKEKQVNRKRIRSKKAPLVEFRLVKIAQPKSQLPSLPQGTHASPRQHWRRGHWRNLASGKRVFIKPALVGDEKNGKIIKDYIVEEPAHAH